MRFEATCFERSSTTSTPRKVREQTVSLPTVSPIQTKFIADAVETSEASGAQQKKKTTVQVRVDWPTKSKTNTLHEGLASLGKMLCRGTFKQIAGAVWKNAILKKHVQQLFLKEIDPECTALCSLKELSGFRSTSEKNLQTLSIKSWTVSELENKAPLFSSVLWTVSLRKSNRDDQFWQPSVCTPPAAL